MSTVFVPNTPAPKEKLCWKTPKQGSNVMVHCDRKTGHQGFHSWQIEDVVRETHRDGYGAGRARLVSESEAWNLSDAKKDLCSTKAP